MIVEKHFMKLTRVILAAALLLAGCSKKSADTPPNDGYAHNVTTNGLPFAVTVVETDQSKERGDLHSTGAFSPAAVVWRGRGVGGGSHKIG
jgi:uncharacterized lipoprotein YajG